MDKKRFYTLAAICVLSLGLGQGYCRTRQHNIVPDVTYRERIGIPADSTVTGRLVYQTDNVSGFYLHDGKAWHALGVAFYKHRAVVNGNLMLTKRRGVWLIKKQNRNR